MTELGEWFEGRPAWLQDAARRLYEQGELEADDLGELVSLCKQEAEGGPGAGSKPFPNLAFQSVDNHRTLRLKAIRDVVGINALAPRKPLKFGTEPLTIIYGSNGSGKSGYMRILKHACGARAPGELLGNVFSKPSAEMSCRIDYDLDGKHSAPDAPKWTPTSGVMPNLKGVAIYDTDCAHIYVDKEHEVTFEPPVLGLFRRLVDVCDQVDQAIQAEITAKTSALPNLPTAYLDTKAGAWLEKIGASTSAEAIAAQCEWSKEDGDGLAALTQRLSETNPQAKATALRKTKKHLVSLTTLLKKIAKQLSDEALNELVNLKEAASVKRRAASDYAERVFADAPMGGIASESWRLLWEQARLFSEEVAYPAKPFPVVEEDALCVLCRQPLKEGAPERLRSFETFIKGGLEKDALASEGKLKVTLENLPDLVDVESADAMLDLARITEDEADLRAELGVHFAMLRSRRQDFGDADDSSKLPTLPDAELIERLEVRSTGLEERAVQCDEDAKNSDQSELLKQKGELEARKWLSEQRSSIKAEVERLKAVALLGKAKRSANTSSLSRKKSELSEELVTDAFKKRLQNELKLLSAKRITVDIEKVRVSKGQVWHRLVLRDAKVNTDASAVLSEGEFRVVSIAAFLADVAADDRNVPFVFDDPISSLDQGYEEKVAERLVNLARSRQVIVFTHRLSLLATLENASKQGGGDHKVVSLLRESWGSGEPGEAPLPAQAPKTALNTLSDRRLRDARKILEEEGSSAYAVLAKALCGDIRITIERLVERELLADVVQRFRRPINTQGKLHKIAKVSTEDCELIDSMMTKYSRYEHAQPDEAPVELPEPDELEEDLNTLKVWLAEFSARGGPS